MIQRVGWIFAGFAIACSSGATPTDSSGNAPPPADHFGVNKTTYYEDAALPAALDEARALGAGWMRIQIYSGIVDPSGGNFTWGLYDRLIPEIRSRNLQILAILGYTQLWNTTAPDSVTRATARDRYPPRNLEAWGRYVFETVSRYKGQVHYWEVWNEPDLFGFWRGTPAQFAELLDVGYREIKRADPGATVLLPGLALGGSNPQSADFLHDILFDPVHPAASRFDIANFHSYGTARDAAQRMAYVKGELQKAGVGSRPIWITEAGYASERSLQAVAGYTAGDASQAAYAEDMLPLLFQLGAAKVFWYQLYDVPTDFSNFRSHGLLDQGKRRKMAFTTVQKLLAN